MNVICYHLFIISCYINTVVFFSNFMNWNLLMDISVDFTLGKFFYEIAHPHMLKSYKAGFYIKTSRVSVIKCFKMTKNRGIVFIYAKTFYYFFQNFYVLIGGFEVHSLRYMQKSFLEIQLWL